MTEQHPPLRDPHLEEVAHWHPIEEPAATRFFIGVPSMGCQWATSARCGSRTGGCRSVMMISVDREDSDGEAVGIDRSHWSFKSTPGS